MDNANKLSGVKAVLDKYKVSPNKKFGQNFLIDDNILKKIVSSAEICSEDFVLEVGPGLGTLTSILLKEAKKVVSVEIDRGFIAILKDRFSEEIKEGKLILIEGDFLKENVEAIADMHFEGGAFKFIANLPYNITTPILMSLTEKSTGVKRAIVMLQKEVGERIDAKPGTKKYSSLTIAIAYKADAKIVSVVPKTCFYPAPNVDSIILRLDFLPKKRVAVKDENLFFEIVRGSFNQRRKTFINSVTASHYSNNISKEELIEIFKKLNIDLNIRGEALTIEQFAEIANMLA